MISTALRILIVEDSEQDSRLFLRELRQGGYEPQSLRVESAAALTAALASQEWDLIICDYRLPQFTGLDALKLVQATGRDLPFILVSGAVGEDQAVAVMKAGAHDFVLKENLSRLPSVVRRELGDAEARRQRTQAVENVARLAAIVESSHDALFGADLDGIITSWNRGAEQILGYRAEEIVGTSIMRLIPEDRQAEEHEAQRQIIAGELGGTFETNRLTKEGREFPASVSIAPLKDAAGKVIGTSRVLRDITERKRAEEAVRAAGERFRFMAEAMPQKICTTKPDGALDYLNARWHEFLGPTLEKLQKLGWPAVIHPDDVEETLRRWRACLDNGQNLELEHRVRNHEGKYRWHLTRSQPLRDGEGKITLWISTNTDIDDMMQAQEELIEAEQQLADRAVQLEALVAERTVKLSSANAQLLVEAEERKRLEAEIAYAVENERARLGQELHDGLVQEMVGVGMLLHVLERQMKKPAPEFSTEAGRLAMMIEKAQENARNLAKNFYPVELEQYGLHVALNGIAQRAQAQHGIRCTVETDEHPMTKLRGARAVQLFRIAQEAVQNAGKHSKASHIVISLRKQNGAWLLTVKDDGIGLPANAQPTGGMGLRILQYRARIIQGTLTVCNNPDRGVTVACSAPSTSPGEPDPEEQLTLSL